MNTYVESAVTRTRELLATPEAAAILGAEALALSAQLESCLIPNNRSGLLSVSREYRNTDSTAIIAVRPRAKLCLGEGFNEFTPGQRAAIEVITAAWNRVPSDTTPPRDIIQAQMDKEQNQKWAFVGNRQERRCFEEAGQPRKYWAGAGSAGTYAEFTGDNNFPAGIALGRPLIFLPYFLTRLGREGEADPVVIGHEFVHARQNIESPIIEIDPQLGFNNTVHLFNTRRELEAYHIDRKIGQVGEALDEDFGVRHFSSKVEDRRLQYAPTDDPFYPAPELCQFLDLPLSSDS